LSSIAAEFYESLSDPQVSPSDAVSVLESKMASSGFNAAVEPVDMETAYMKMIDRIYESQKRQYDVGVQTGLRTVDDTTGGLFPGELCICAARPSIGKTALGFQIAEYAADQGRPALFVSLETEDWELAARSAAAETGINGAAIRSAKLTDDQMSLLKAMARAKAGIPLKIWRPVRTTVASIRSQAKLMAATGGIALLAVDYLQLIDPADPRALRHEQLSQIGKDLKRLANELDIPVLALAQINRKGEGERPKLSQLEGSGSLEQDANTVWLINREDRSATDAVLMIEKNRSGSVGDVPLVYDCEKTMFYDSCGESFSPS
jgi:replicative DNA helicase